MPEASDDNTPKLPSLHVIEGKVPADGSVPESETILGLKTNGSGRGASGEQALPALSTSMTAISQQPHDSDCLFTVVHSIPGRLRLRVPSIKMDPALGQRFAGALVAFPGVQHVRINRLAASIAIEYDPAINNVAGIASALNNTDLSKVKPIEVPHTPIRQAGLLLERLFNFFERITPPVVQLAAGAASLTAAMLELPLAGVFAWAACSPILCRALRTAIEERKISVDGLDGMAAVLMIAHSNFRAASFMMTLIGLGEYIRELTANRCKKIIEDLLGLAGRSAWLVKGKKRICIPADQVKLGDTVVVYPGEMMPVDGTVIKGEALINQASLTGESVPVEVREGHSVFAATVVVHGQVYINCTATLTNSRASQVIDLVNAAPLHETRIQNYAAVMADKAVVPIIGSAATCFLFSRNITQMMSMLIYDFSTGIRISAPTAVLASMASAGKQGILVKSGGALERLARVNAIIFDKTGTLTSGKPSVNDVFIVQGNTQDDVVSLAASVEQRLSHPAAQAIVNYAQLKGLEIPSRIDTTHSRGMGVSASVDGKQVLVGSRRMMDTAKIDLQPGERFEKEAMLRGSSMAYVAIDGKLAGILAYADTVRPEAKEMIRKLHRRNIKRIIMATGDNEFSARRIAGELGLDDVLSSAFPEHKAELVLKLKSEGFTVAVVGDGINDSPALAHADVAISLRGGTDAAREHADVVLTDDDLLRLPQTVDIARSAMNLVKETMALVAVPNGTGLVMTACGMVGPAGATLLNNGSAIVAALNSLRPLMGPGWSRIPKSQI